MVAVGVGILAAEMLKLSGIFSDAEEDIKGTADEIKIADTYFKDFMTSIESSGDPSSTKIIS